MNVIRNMLVRQFGAASQMLHESIENCPAQLWTKGTGGEAFWHLAYHIIFFLDLYLHERESDFIPAPFHREDAWNLAAAPSGEPYSKAMLIEYLQLVRKRAQSVLAGLTEEDLAAPSPVPWYTIQRGEFLLNSLRHAQHHIGQLNFILRSHGSKAPKWQGTSEL